MSEEFEFIIQAYNDLEAYNKAYRTIKKISTATNVLTKMLKQKDVTFILIRKVKP